ncbi:MAG: tRNA (N6-isopentenyl adenosine(37)-C2)-methylthiotransferase MiaB [Spirochaetaceae bacterium]|nr:tRNA (N6-isopentenyl adenosine(37)-C2)-methylthiotransferase MiaB [Spirochaetaceae bacterium]
MKYFFETYGCQMNKAESAAIEQIFMDRGWQDAGCAEDADFIVINTCSVRATAESRIAGRLGWFTTLRRERQKAGTGDFTLVVTGCMAERLKDDLKKQFKVVDYVVGTFQRQHFTELIEAAENKTRIEYMDEEPVYSFAPLSYEKGTFQAYVPIMHGCNNFCTYCIVPYVRGREVSRNPDEILKELDMLSERGVREITLLGQNVNSYMWKTADSGDDGSFIDFPDLMQLIADHLRETSSSIGWVRFMSSHPKDISERLIDVIAKERVMCRHIHLPVQHGSTRILQAMNRRYTREDYLAKVRMIRSKLPDVSLTTDIMLGFPGETDEDFEEAVSLLQEVKYEAAFMYYYNPREGTKACTMPDQIPMEVKKNRLAKVIDIQLAINRAEMSKRVGTTTKVLVECVSKDNENELLGRTEQDEHVVFAADKSLIGSFVDVKLLELTGNTFKGTL